MNYECNNSFDELWLFLYQKLICKVWWELYTTTNRQHNGLRWRSLRWLLFLHQSRLPYSRLYLCVLLEILSMLVSTLDSTKSCQPSQTVSDNILLACLLTSTWNTDTFNIYSLVWRSIMLELYSQWRPLTWSFSPGFDTPRGEGLRRVEEERRHHFWLLRTSFPYWAGGTAGRGRGRTKTEREVLASPLLASSCNVTTGGLVAGRGDWRVRTNSSLLSLLT